MRVKKADQDFDLTPKPVEHKRKKTKLRKIIPYGDGYYVTLEPIEHILAGPSLAIIGSQDFIDRNIIQEQMAVAIATGEPFLNHFETQHRRVLILRKGVADYEGTIQRIDKIFRGPAKYRPVVEMIDNRVWLEATDQLIRKGTYQVWDEATNKEIDIPSGLLGYLENCFKKWEYDVVFIPEYPQIRTGVGKYLEHHEMDFSGGIKKIVRARQGVDDTNNMTVANVKITIGQSAFQQIKNDRDDMCIQMLRDFAEKKCICLIMGHGLTTENIFRAPYQIKNASLQLILKYKSKAWKLDIAGGGGQVPGNTWGLEYSEDDFFRLSDKEVDRFSPVSWTNQEKKIIRAMRGQGCYVSV